MLSAAQCQCDITVHSKRANIASGQARSGAHCSADFSHPLPALSDCLPSATSLSDARHFPVFFPSIVTPDLCRSSTQFLLLLKSLPLNLLR